MSVKLGLEVGEIVETHYAPGWHNRAKVLEVDSHPFEYDRVLIELMDSPASDTPKVWVSEKILRRL